MVPPPALSDALAYLTEMMTREAPLFVASGIKIFDAFAVIVVVWFGIQWAQQGGMSQDRFSAFLMKLSFGFAMQHFYVNPIPGFGVNFYQLIVNEGTYLANLLNQGISQDIFARLNAVYAGMETPSWSLGNVMEYVRYIILTGAILGAEIAVFGVIAYGYVAVGVAVLLGPIFIPFFLIPVLDWLFWGWLKSLFQYAFYPVVANAYVYVFGKMLINFVNRTGPPYDGAKIGWLFGPLLFILIAFAFGLFKVPSLVNSLFTGRAGESALPIVR